MNRPRSLLLTAFIAGALAGAATCAVLSSPSQTANAQATATQVDPGAIQTRIETIEGKLTDQAHVMQDVGHHFANLWFAGRHENWELANFYWTETRSHLRWAVRIIPKRKDNAGRDVDLVTILQAFENGPLQQLQAAITAKNKAAFAANYRTSMETCYDCHKAADKPFLRPQVPERPESTIMNFDPHATWPR